MTTKKNLKQKAQVMESKYAISALTDESENIFGTGKIIAEAALKAAGKGEYTEREAIKIVESFRKKEVR